MKRCDWCGQEYPDDAAVCAIDGRALPSLEIAATPLVAQPGEAPTPSDRPVPVWVAGGLMIVSGIGGTVMMLYAAMRPELHGRISQASAFTNLVAFGGSVLRVVCGVGVFRRKNAARWTFLGWAGVTVLWSAVKFGINIQTYAQAAFVAGIGLLLTLGAGDYFERRPAPVTSETPPSRSAPESETGPGSESAP
jgi:hypothetical protein